VVSVVLLGLWVPAAVLVGLLSAFATSICGSNEWPCQEPMVFVALLAPSLSAAVGFVLALVFGLVRRPYRSRFIVLGYALALLGFVINLPMFDRVV
jgi:hypothetical protein